MIADTQVATGPIVYGIGCGVKKKGERLSFKWYAATKKAGRSVETNPPNCPFYVRGTNYNQVESGSFLK